MNSIYQFTSYRRAIEDRISFLKKQDKRYTIVKIADHTRIQPAYITNVIKGRAHFNCDQVHSIAQYLEWQSEEIEYLELLLEYERSTHQHRKDAIKSKIESIRKGERRTVNQLSHYNNIPNDIDAENYYLNPQYKIVHVALQVEKLNGSPEKVAEFLDMEMSKVRNLLEDLVSMRYITKIDQGKYEVIKKSFHLPAESPYCTPHQILLRNLCLEKLRNLGPEQKKSVSVTFSGTKETKEKIEIEFNNFLKKCEDLVKGSASQNLFQLNFDLFPWSRA